MENNELYSFGDLPVSALMHNEVEQVDDEVVEHSGIKGMKWGVRRYQNKDGSLTPAGKKRYNQELSKIREAEKVLKTKQATKGKIDRLNARKKAVEEGEHELNKLPARSRIASKKGSKAENDASTENKSVKDMSDDELRKKINRMELEKQFKNLQSEVSPKKVNRGKVFMDKFKDEAIDKLAKTVAADLVAQTAKAVGVSAINQVLNKTLDPDGDGNNNYVHTNNKK